MACLFAISINPITGQNQKTEIACYYDMYDCKDNRFHANRNKQVSKINYVCEIVEKVRANQ